ncbi:MAG: restriction endonuclease subunit S [Elusimicrobia bacterium]|nr:restriction endonuclease subunit S [Elusimicrobiota bacterium]
MKTNYKELIKAIGFSPKNGTTDIYYKQYKNHNSYIINIDFSKEKIDYGTLITFDTKTTQNFSKNENFVVLECVDRLLEKGYKPQNIILEKSYPSGHGHSGILDILVIKNTKAFLMIECKTWGKEFNDEFSNIQKNGGQLLTYFQNDKYAEYLMLYASRLDNKKIDYKNEIIKVEEYYRQAGNVVDTYERWNKQTYSNGIFDKWVNIYCYKNKPLTKSDLIELTEENSGKIFHGFLSILRKHSVSDKPNAFNKIFNLFLAKIYDERKRKDDELEFQWLEEKDNPVDFEVRLYNLHKAGLYEFLKKEIEGISDNDFKYENEQELLEKKKKLLKFNKVFDIKDVIDDESFDDNFRVLKEVVQLLEKYKIRYPRKQQHLSDFFERLLTTGLKQEAGQFFTPPPITKFITKSLPLDKMLTESINQPVPKLPAVIDYAAGSGHFITEMMEAYQDCINELNTNNFYPEAKTMVDTWKTNPYSWAGKYIYGIEKDYRLVKVAKVGCYFYGDGLAQVIHGDGLDSFKYSKNYVGLLSENIKIEDSSKAKFAIVVSNPPYSVDAFKGDIKNINVNKEFELYKYLTDRSSEIECLFVERTKQLLKDGGIAGIILPSSILTNSGIYTKTRELLLKYFEIIAITELGSNTFMATGTNTVVLFLRRRNNNESINLQEAVNKFFTNYIDVTIINIEKPITKYINYVWKNLSFNDYISLLKQKPNEKVKKHDLFKEYSQKIKFKDEKDFFNKIIELEKEKIYYFILTCNQKVVIIRTGEKDKEKQFLGYEFSNRRGYEGIHSIQKGKNIDECTRLFDAKSFDNPKKASTYIYKAFNGDFETEIDESLKENVSRNNLIDMMIFDRFDFEKNINLSFKKKVNIDSKFEIHKLGELVENLDSKRIPLSKNERVSGKIPYYGATGIIDYVDEYIFNEKLVLIGEDGAKWGANEKSAFQISGKTWVNNHAHVLRPNRNKILDKYLIEILNKYDLSSYITGQNVPKLNQYNLNSIQIPLPPIETQQKIINEIEKIEKQNNKDKEKIEKLKNNIDNIFDSISKTKKYKIGQVLTLEYGKSLPKANRINGIYPVVGSNGIDGYHNEYMLKAPNIIVGRKGSVGKINLVEENCTPIDTCFYVKINSDIIDFKFCYYMLKRANLEKLNTGLGPGGLNRNTAYNIEVNIPSLQEQQKIVSQIEKFKNQINETQKIIDNSKLEKQKILDKYLKG